MLTLGIDQSSSNSGICLLDSNATIVALQRISPPEAMREGARLQYIRNALQQIITEHSGIVCAAMEGYSYGSVNKKFVLGEIGGVVKLVCADNNISLLVVAPKQRAKFATGHGAGDKEQVQAGIKAKWGEVIPQNDESDAYVLARIAYASLHQGSKNRAELEILNNIALKPLRKARGKRRINGLLGAV